MNYIIKAFKHIIKRFGISLTISYFLGVMTFLNLLYFTNINFFIVYALQETVSIISFILIEWIRQVINIDYFDKNKLEF